MTTVKELLQQDDARADKRVVFVPTVLLETVFQEINNEKLFIRPRELFADATKRKVQEVQLLPGMLVLMEAHLRAQAEQNSGTFSALSYKLNVCRTTIGTFDPFVA